MSKLSLVAFMGRHIRISLRYISIRKITNLIFALFYYLIGKTKIPTLPAFLKVEVSRKCKMNCPYCWAYAKKAEKFYPFDKYKELIDLLCRYVFEVSLYDIGEPLWCENLIDYIEYAHNKRVGTSISTSLSLVKDDSYWDRLVSSGLDYLIVAIDGVTQDVYSKYRTNGDLALVISNLKKILEARKRHKNNLLIEWQMINFEWNRHEQPLAEKMSEELGVDYFKIIENIIPSRSAAQEDTKFIRRSNCLLPYIIFIVNAYNEVNPCYKYYNEFMKIGDLNNESFMDIWNGKNIACIRSRSLIKARKVCNKCRESMFF